MKIQELVKAAHENAVAKGWWEEERSFDEAIALIHSEVSEALEDFRAGKKPTDQWYTWNGNDDFVSEKQEDATWKPCGIPSELADVCIRIFDLAGRYWWGEPLEKFYNSACPGFVVKQQNSFPANLNVLHGNLTDCDRADSWKAFKLAIVIQNVNRLASFCGINLEEAIREKMAYNATRPHRHGGKVL